LIIMAFLILGKQMGIGAGAVCTATRPDVNQPSPTVDYW
jgi:hypothetical protein